MIYAGFMKRITISVPESVAEKVNRAVSRGDAESVSAYFADLAAREPDWAAAGDAIDRMIVAAGGISEDDQEWALRSLGIRDARVVA